MQARLRAYWWWLNGNVTKAAITRDLEEMKAKGFGGALICDAGGAEQDGNDRVPHGPDVLHPRVARALQAHPARGGPAGPGDEPQHPERLEPRRADGQGRGRGQEAGLVGDAGARARRKIRCKLPEPKHPATVLPRRVRSSPIRVKAGSAADSAGPIQNWEKKALHQGRCASPRRTPRRCSRSCPPSRARRTRAPARWST